MILFSDDESYARRVFPEARDWTPWSDSPSPRLPWMTKAAAALFCGRSLFRARQPGLPRDWILLATEFSPFSQYDRVIALRDEQGELPDRLACLAGSGENFHGQRSRTWVAAAGNIHLTVHFRPPETVPDCGRGFPLLAAVSVLDTLDSLPGLEGRASVKWVNDILLDSAKVAGFVAHLQSQDEQVRSAVLGLGLNVETTPPLQPSPFVPRATCAKAVSPQPQTCSLGAVLILLINRLEENYRKLCSGDLPLLLTRYRRRSEVLGRRVRVLSDPLEGPPRELGSGIVTAIGENLELHLRGRDKPLSRGRLILLD